MPEVTDADMHMLEDNVELDHEVGPFRKQYNLFLAVWSQVCRHYNFYSSSEANHAVIIMVLLCWCSSRRCKLLYQLR